MIPYGREDDDKTPDVRDNQLFPDRGGHPPLGSNNSVSVDCLLPVRVCCPANAREKHQHGKHLCSRPGRYRYAEGW